MDSDFEVRIDGADQLRRALEQIGPKLRKKVVRGALRKAARLISADAKRRAPVLRVPSPYRKPGTVRRAIGVRVSKVAQRQGDEGVFVNVRPAKGARYRTVARIGGVSARVKTRSSQRGAKSKNDPYYWRFVEFGTRKMRARPFLRTAADANGAQALDSVVREMRAGIDKIDKGAL